MASAGDPKSAKADPLSACVHPGPVASATEFKANRADEDHSRDLLSQDASSPTSFELFPGQDLNTKLLVQAKIPTGKAGCTGDDCWRWISDMPGYVRIIETMPTGEPYFIDIPVDQQNLLVFPHDLKHIPLFLRYNIDIQKLRVRIGSTLEFRYFLDLCPAFGGEDPLIISKTLQPYTTEVQDNFTSAASHLVGYIQIDVSPSMIKKESATLPDSLKDADKAVKKTP